MAYSKKSVPTNFYAINSVLGIGVATGGGTDPAPIRIGTCREISPTPVSGSSILYNIEGKTHHISDFKVFARKKFWTKNRKMSKCACSGILATPLVLGQRLLDL